MILIMGLKLNLISHPLINSLAVSTSFKVWVHKEIGIRV